MAYSSILFAQVRPPSAFGRIQSMASSYLLRYKNFPANVASFLPQVASIILPLIHQENGLHYLLLTFSLLTENLPVLLSPRSRNRELHWYLIPMPYWLHSRAWLRSGYVLNHVLVHLHLDRIDVYATHQLSAEGLNILAQVSVQALSSLRKEVQPSSGELPIFISLNSFICGPTPGGSAAWPHPLRSHHFSRNSKIGIQCSLFERWPSRLQPRVGLPVS